MLHGLRLSPLTVIISPPPHLILCMLYGFIFLTCQSSRSHSYHLSTTTPHIAHAVWFKIIASHSYHLSTTTPHIVHAVWFKIIASHSYHLSTTTPHIVHAVWFKIIASHSYHLSTTTPHIAHAVWFHILNVPILSLSQLSSLHHHTSYCTCCMVSYS